jgi:hypothetical protein
MARAVNRPTAARRSARGKAKVQPKPKAKPITRKRNKADASAQETCAANKMMAVQNRATIQDIVTLLKETPSMILPTYKLLVKKLLVPSADSNVDSKLYLPENNTKLTLISNKSLRPFIQQLCPTLSDEVLDSWRMLENNIEKVLFLYATVPVVF